MNDEKSAEDRVKSALHKEIRPQPANTIRKREDDKPDPVGNLKETASCHLSRGIVTNALKRHHRDAAEAQHMPLFGLASDGVYLDELSPDRRLAPEASISPCLISELISGLFSVALSVAFRPPAFRWHPLL